MTLYNFGMRMIFINHQAHENVELGSLLSMIFSCICADPYAFNQCLAHCEIMQVGYINRSGACAANLFERQSITK